MPDNPGPVSRKQGEVPQLASETEENCKPTLPPRNSLLRTSSLPSSSSSSSSLLSRAPPSSVSSSSSSGASSSSSGAGASSLPPPSSQRRSSSTDQRRRSKTVRERQRQFSKRCSEPAMPTMEESLAMEADSKEGSVEFRAYRRCMTDTDFKSVQGVPTQAAPDLLQLFNIFQSNTPERPSARMLVNVTLVGNIQPVRLLVAYDALVQDVIKASLKAYAKEGRISRHCIKSQPYGLHYSPFCIESIDPTEMISSLGTRSFFLFPRVTQLSSPTETSKEGKPWWKILSLMLT